MQTVTDWISCGARKSRAVLTLINPADDVARLEDAKDFYHQTTLGGQPTLDARMSRAVKLQRTFGVACKHEYNPE